MSSDLFLPVPPSAACSPVRRAAHTGNQQPEVGSIPHSLAPAVPASRAPLPGTMLRGQPATPRAPTCPALHAATHPAVPLDPCTSFPFTIPSPCLPPPPSLYTVPKSLVNSSYALSDAALTDGRTTASAAAKSLPPTARTSLAGTCAMRAPSSRTGAMAASLHSAARSEAE